jgi:hypothetical protein
LAVIRTIRGVHRPAGTVEAHFTADMALEFGLKLIGVRKRINRLGVGAGRERMHIRADENLTADKR